SPGRRELRVNEIGPDADHRAAFAVEDFSGFLAAAPGLFDPGGAIVVSRRHENIADGDTIGKPKRSPNVKIERARPVIADILRCNDRDFMRVFAGLHKPAPSRAGQDATFPARRGDELTAASPRVQEPGGPPPAIADI